MTIRANILRVKKQILNEIDEHPTPHSDDVQRKSLAAVRKGIGSDEWKEYMLQFVDDPSTIGDPASISARQLARLMGTDATPQFDDPRAYLVADGGCTGETGVHFGNFASEVLDIGLGTPAVAGAGGAGGGGTP
jgi:hypothetical protein